MTSPLLELPPAEKIGAEIRMHRTSRGLSQAALAKAAGTTQAVIARIETGKANPTLATLVEIADALNMHVQISLQ